MKISTSDNEITPLYREKIQESLQLTGLLIKPVSLLTDVLRVLKGCLYNMRGVRCVSDASELLLEEKEPFKLLLLDPKKFSPIEVNNKENNNNISHVWVKIDDPSLPPLIQERMKLLLSNEKSSSTKYNSIQIAMIPHTIKLNYKNFTMPELLHKILPSDAVALSGFEQIGHIAHVNLSTSHLPFKHDIGNVILDCNPTVSVVVNKIDSISSVFREFKMEIIAKRPNINNNNKDINDNELLLATVRQHGCIFRVPYDRVYWNSRLSHEHTRIVNLLKEGDILYDVMAGVGPFAIPAAVLIKNITVYANDLNPTAAEYLKINAELNHIKKEKFHVYNLDGREFMNTILYNDIMQHNLIITGRRHVTMNLPAIAVEFLDVFAKPPWNIKQISNNIQNSQEKFKEKEFKPDTNVIFHVYCFSKNTEDFLGDAVKQVEHFLSFKLSKENLELVHMVRDVAPLKRMICVSFTLPDIFWKQFEYSEEGPLKRTRVN